MLDSTLVAGIITAIATIGAVWLAHWLQKINIDTSKKEATNTTTIENVSDIKYYPTMKNGHIFINRFIINSFMGRGSFSNVYLVMDKTSQDKKQIILKLFKYKEQPQYIINYIDKETHLANKFKNKIPGIAKYYEVNWLPEKKGVFILQEYVQSNSLHDLLLTKTFTEEEAILIAIKLCETLSYIHKNNIVHCDIKPKNILISVENDMTPIIIDFGVSRYFGISIQKEETFISLPYTAPEIINLHSVDARTDIYSLAVTILHMLFGLSDWESDKIAQYDYLTMQIPPSQEEMELVKVENHINLLANQVTNENLKNLLVKSLSKNINYRYNSVLDLKKELMLLPKEHNNTLERNI